MSIDLHQTALLRFLEKRSSTYHGKVFEVRDEVIGWLVYVPQTFPHYTRHTIGHSEEIVSQMSQLLFTDGDVGQPILAQLSAVEAYILVIAAFLHDSGMVASEAEKSRILATAEWQEWVKSGGGATRWQAADELRNGAVPTDVASRNFLADIQVRYLIAEFVRRRHHLRSGDVIREHQEKLGRFAFNDPSLIETIANVCIAHGLASHELADHDRFPDRRNIRGEKVNVRLLAILLRLGDLLDMSHDRACPLLLSAACPLPAESLAHWSQYQRITHRMTAPDRIEITARCETQDEHRFLYDWCRWLAQEAREAEFTLKESRRHKWDPPKVTLDTPNPTISISPAANANYIPRNWTFELDSDAVFQRLIYDAYDVPHVFVRELIQNAADASRCRMYTDLKSQSRPRPKYPTDVDEETRQRYPIRVTSSFATRENNLSGEKESLQTITVEDQGVGMDIDVIQRYFLQVGRSFYVTDEFRREYGFAATSRFGIGFLSTFAESEDIEVETFKAGSADGAIRLRLTGPRSYLLTEHGTRRTTGTRIHVAMKTPVSDDDLILMIRHWCRMLEFPVEVMTAAGRIMTIAAERPDDFTEELPDFSVSGARYIIRSFPVDEDGIRGHLYLCAWIGVGGEELWARFGRGLDRYPGARIPDGPLKLRALHGINLQSNWQAKDYTVTPTERIDLRASESVAMSRSSESDRDAYVSTVLRRAWTQLLMSHLSTPPARFEGRQWLYLQGLMTKFYDKILWDDVPGMVQFFENGQSVCLSLAETSKLPRFLMLAPTGRPSAELDTRDLAAHLSGNGTPTMCAEDLGELSLYCLDRMIQSRYILTAHFIDNLIVTEWSLSTKTQFLPRRRAIGSGELFLGAVVCDVPILYCNIGYTMRVIVSSHHTFGEWLSSVRAAFNTGQPGLSEKHVYGLEAKIVNCCEQGWNTDELAEFIAHWREIPNLPPDLVPPDVDLNQLAFRLAE